VTPEVVFPYFTDPALIVTWIGDRAELDPQPGMFALDMGEVLARGTYVTVDPPRRVGRIDRRDRADPRRRRHDGRVQHRGLHSGRLGDHRAGWEDCLERLHTAVARPG
jgi:uncharacterized protein YndB with AHSA1/START domain